MTTWIAWIGYKSYSYVYDLNFIHVMTDEIIIFVFAGAIF